MKTRFLLIVLFTALVFVPRGARAQLSETERKAAARAAYQEGVKLQDEGKPAEALARFESAQKLYDAPTHLLHIAECQALTGRLVEASETYESLVRRSLPPGSPEVFIQAQQQGQAELPALRARIPTLRVTVRPGPPQVQNLVINVNGVTMANELIGIARPLNPGLYRFSAQGNGWATASSVDVPLAEKEQKSIELTLQQRPTAAAPPPGVLVPAPAPPTAQTPAPAPPPYQAPETVKPKAVPTSAGLLLGVRGGLMVPGGEATSTVDMSEVASTGGAFGIDAYLRLARMLLLGATFDYSGLGEGKARSFVSNAAATNITSSSVHTTYVGVNIGILPNVDRVSFIGDIGIGSRSLSYSSASISRSTSGVEFVLGAGLSIPIGPIRLVPRFNLGLGSFAPFDGAATRSNVSFSDARGTHAFAFLGLALYYSINFGSKPTP